MLFQKILIAMMILGSMLTACSDATKTSTNTIFVNNTGQHISFNKYFEGIASVSPSVNLEIDISERETSSFSQRGLSKGGTSYPSLNKGDSIVVTYGNSIKQVHLGIITTSSNTKAIKFDDPRNILNEKNYLFRIKESSRRSQKLEYEYTFTVEDYQRALR